MLDSFEKKKLEIIQFPLNLKKFLFQRVKTIHSNKNRKKNEQNLKKN